ncbi:MAG: hypothetical protein JWM07_762 [Candidatus Saccharibacteria bacterium]|nr:hypothetical protein [Candidatus Saccharibacteria bacterium]
MSVRRTFRTILTGEPTSVGSPDKKEGFAMRYQRLGSWFLGICVAVYVGMVASPATASVPGITKVCPDAKLKVGPDDIVGRLWGYAEVFGPIIALGALALLILVAAVPKLRVKVMPFVVWPLVLLMLFGTAVTVFSSLPGTSC